MAVVTMRELLDSGVHFGHQTRRWNPKMKRFIFTERNGIYIIDIQQSLALIDQAYAFTKDVVAKGGHILFVGTKKQAHTPIINQAARVGMPTVTERWLGGMLTNFPTVLKRIQRLKELEALEEKNDLLLTKKELLMLRREREKLFKNLDGIRNMTKLPSALWVVDTKKEHLAIQEAKKLGIPVIAILDTNCDPDEVDYKIPGNDDAIRSIGLLTRVITDAIAEGMKARSIFATPELATAYLAQCAESFSDFADIPAALVGIDSEGNFDPEIYTDQTEVMVATLRAEKQIKAIVVTAVPILDALLAREDGRAWAQKIIHKELNHVAVRPLREAANIAAVVSEMPTTLDGYIASGRDGGSGLMEAFNALYKSTNELLSEKSAAWKRARLFKNELKRALEQVPDKLKKKGLLKALRLAGNVVRDAARAAAGQPQVCRARRREPRGPRGRRPPGGRRRIHLLDLRRQRPRLVHPHPRG